MSKLGHSCSNAGSISSCSNKKKIPLQLITGAWPIFKLIHRHVLPHYIMI